MMQEINIIDNVTIPIIDEPIGINVSGGTDSALLLFFLMKYASKKIYIFTLANRRKRRLNAKCTIDIVDKCIELTGNTNIQHIINYAENQNQRNVKDLPNNFLSKKNIKILYEGVTANPPQEVLNNFTDMTTELDRDSTIIKPVFRTPDLCWPWVNLDKKTIAKIYNEYNLIETLFSITRSCETLSEFENRHCGYCWWCQERKWGFGRLD